MPRDKVAKIYSKTSLKDGAAVQQILDRSFICDNIREICGQTKTTVAWFGYSVTRLDDFLKFLVTKFPKKVTQIISNFLGYFEKPHSYVKTALATSWKIFGLLFTPTSGHTARRSHLMPYSTSSL